MNDLRFIDESLRVQAWSLAVSMRGMSRSSKVDRVTFFHKREDSNSWQTNLASRTLCSDIQAGFLRNFSNAMAKCLT